MRCKLDSLTDLGAAPSSAAERVKTVIESEIGNTYEVFGPADGAWCQTFLNWCAVQAGESRSSTQVYQTSGCSTMINSRLGTRYKPKASGFRPSAGDWVYYKDTRQNQSDTAHHVGYIRSASNTTLTTIEANRNGSAVQQFTQPIDGFAENSTLYVIGYAVPPYKPDDGDILFE